MPTYSYVCNACGHEFDRFHAMTDEPIQVCPSCGRKRVRRRIGTGVGLIFKGSGFYLTDYARKSPPGKSAATGDDQGKAEKSGEKAESPSTGQKSDK